MDLKPIETHYKGYRFRSRLEARWAVFLSSLGYSWEYEKEGYVINGRPYLPDFWIPVITQREDGWGIWIEIKPCELTCDQNSLLAELARQGGHHVYAICGSPSPKDYEITVFRNHMHFIPNVPHLIHGRFIEKIDSSEFSSIIIRSKDGRQDMVSLPSPEYEFRNNPKTGKLKLAYNRALSARFEHGEKPTVGREVFSQTIKCSINEMDVSDGCGNSGYGVQAHCSRCGYETESFGTEEPSRKRCLALLREGCPKGEKNRYVEDFSRPLR